MTRTAVLRDPGRAAEFRRDGYTVFPLLDADEVVALRAAYRALVPPGDFGLTIDYMRPDRAAMAAIAELLAPYWARHLPEVLVDHRPVFTTFVTKHPGEGSDMFLHEDRTFVDERRYRAATLWVPLVDVGPGVANGGLEVVPRSHLLTAAWSGSNTPELFRPFEATLRRALRPVSVPAGWGLLYDTRTLHASPANLSASPREAIVCAVAPVEAELVHVVATSKRRRRVHRVDERFFVDLHPRVLEKAVPEEYPNICEFDDVCRLDPTAIRDVVGSTAAAAIAPDAGPLTAAGVVRRRPGALPPFDADPAETAASMGWWPGLGDGALTVLDGAAGAALLDAPPASGSTPGWAAGLRPSPADADVVGLALVVEPGARVRMRTGRQPVTIEVGDVAASSAGLEAAGQIEHFADGEAWDVSAPEATIFNNGPGVAALVLLMPAGAVRGFGARRGRRTVALWARAARRRRG